LPGATLPKHKSMSLPQYNINDEVELRTEQGQIHRVTHEVQALNSVPNKNLVTPLKPYMQKLLQQQREKRFQIITGLVMEVQEIDKILQPPD